MSVSNWAEFFGVFALSSDAFESLVSVSSLTDACLFAGSIALFFHFKAIATMKNYEGCDKHDTDTKSYHHQLIGFWWWLVWLVWRNKLTIVICYFLINRIIRFHVVRIFDISFAWFWFVADWRFFINIGLFISVEISLCLCLCCLFDGCFFIRPRISGI